MSPPTPKSLRVVCVAIPFDPTTDKILMVSSRKHPQLWILPKGGHEPQTGESLAEAARRESFEEAGTLSSAFASPPPSPILTTSDAKTLYHFFPLSVTSLAETWLEASERRRDWVAIDEAQRRIGEWKAIGNKGKKEGKKDPEGRVRKMELQEGLEAWKTWREKGKGKA